LISLDFDWSICCSVAGSENNHLYVYYKGLADPLMSYDFTPSSNASNFLDPSPGRSTINSESANDFVSAVCWKKVRPPFFVHRNHPEIISVLIYS
jgi:hypothetical protein